MDGRIDRESVEHVVGADDDALSHNEPLRQLPDTRTSPAQNGLHRLGDLPLALLEQMSPQLLGSFVSC